MPLISLWDTHSDAVSKLNIEQVVAIAGDGNLKDESECSQEFRDFLRHTDSSKLNEFAAHCLTKPFSKSGLVLQDIANEFGRRLEYDVRNGRYQGVRGEIGFDGLWFSKSDQQLIIEVKTTDAYRISLDTIAKYRTRLLSEELVNPRATILIVVGREDTGDLEAQIRGSRHAWDVRLLSVGALYQLVQLREDAEVKETVEKIQSLLTPFEATKIDNIIDVMFTTAQAVEAASKEERPSDDEDDTTHDDSHSMAPTRTYVVTDSQILQQKRENILRSFGRIHGSRLTKKSRALYWDPSSNLRVACAMSKRYNLPSAPERRYWYGYPPRWNEFLIEGSAGYLILGGMDIDLAFAIPQHVMKDNLMHLHTTEPTDGRENYWHLLVDEPELGKFVLALPKISDVLELTEFSFEQTE